MKARRQGSTVVDESGKSWEILAEAKNGVVAVQRPVAIGEPLRHSLKLSVVGEVIFLAGLFEASEITFPENGSMFVGTERRLKVFGNTWVEV